MTNLHILYIEDDNLDRTGFMRMVHSKDLPWNIVTAETLAEARAELKTREFDVIVADDHLPDGESSELFDEFPALPFVLATGALEESLAVRTLERGADDYLVKDTEMLYLAALPLSVEKTVHRKRIRERERKVTEQLEALIQGVSEYAIFMLDPQGRVTVWNPGAERIKGYKSEEVIGRHFSCFFTEEDVAHNLPTRMLELADEKGSYSAEGWRVRKDGTRFWADVTATALRDERGEIRGFVKISRDMTDKKLAEHELHEEQVYNRLLLESNIDAIVVTDSAGIITDVNKQMESFTGCPRAELIESPFASHFTDGERAEAALQLTLKEGRIADLEMHMRAPGGAETPTSCTLTLLPQGLAKVSSVLVVARDITVSKIFETAQREYRAEVQRALDEKTLLLKEVHHRVKNNLHTVNILLSMQIDHCAGNSGVTQPLQEAYGRVSAMSLIHEQIYRSDTLGHLDFSGYIETFANRLFEAYCVDPSRVTIQTQVKPIHLDVNSAVPFGLILNELLSNALKHAFPDGRSGMIQVSLGTTESGLIDFAVSDNGVGIPDGFQVEDSKSLGLLVVQELTRQLDGNLSTISSDAGTTFRLRCKMPEKSYSASA